MPDRPTSKAASRLPPFNLLDLTVILAVLAVAALVIHPRWAAVEEYRDTLFGHRAPTVFKVSELSSAWTEKTVRQRFPDSDLWCGPYRGPMKMDRACDLKTQAYNGVSATRVAFFFKEGQLREAVVHVASWAHADGYHDLLGEFGKPYASQPLPAKGVRLHGWRLQDGAGVFYNRDRPTDPLESNAIYWRSAQDCRTGCFRDGFAVASP